MHNINIKRLTRKEAKQILAYMREILEQYGEVTLGDYYDLIGGHSKWTDNKVGWTSLREAKVKWVFPWWFKIDLPRPLPLE